MKVELSEKQKEICKAEGKCVVRACPGSGKTFTVAAKMAHLLKNWPYDYQGVAVISFTNVAGDEIQSTLSNSFSVNIPIKHPHFLGTIDSFINKFIFFPYGHLVLGCKNRPILAGAPVYDWKIREKDRYQHRFFDKISYDDERGFYKIKQAPIRLYENGSRTKNYENIEKMKKMFWRKGYVNQSDANYFAMKLIESNRSIARLIALRFPFIIIDEAQDTSKIQMKIIDYIVECGLNDIMLVGDPDQAIFEWNSANPKLFKEKADKWHCIHMNENWRSSQRICDFTHHLADLNKPSTSKNKDLIDYTGYSHDIWDYNPNDIDYEEELINPFLKICEDNEIPLDSSKIAILARSRNLLNEIIFSRNKNVETDLDITKLDIWLPNNYTRELAYSKYLYDKNDFRKSFELLEKTYMSIFQCSTIYSDYNLSEMIEKEGYFDFKKKIFNLIKLMPKTDMSIGEWRDKFKENLSSNDSFPDMPMDINDKYEDLNFDDLFSYDIIDNEYPYNLSTIHRVKGETFEAVLLILKKKGSNQLYSNLLTKGKNTLDNEELRNVYVGITRPRKILVLAVPSKDKDIWEDYFSGKYQERSKQVSLTDFIKVKSF